jgi:hypothetical protein
MVKKMLPVLLAWSFFLGGCNKTVNEALEALRGRTGRTDEAAAVKLNQETRYYNDAIGVSCAVPKNWWLYGVNEANLSPERGDITGDVSMDISYGEDGGYAYSYAGLLSFGNLKESRLDNHLGLDLDARSLEGIDSIASFMKYYETFMLEPTDEAEYTLLESEQLTLDGRNFEIRVYLLDRDEDDYHILTATCPARDGWFFNVEASYWPKNAGAKKAIIDYLTNSVELY